MAGSSEEIQLKQLLEESLAVKSVLAERFGITIEIRLDDPHIILRGDRVLLRVALGNLIDDAIKMNDRGRKVLIRQHSDGGSVVIGVSRPGNGLCRGLPAVPEGFPAGHHPGPAGDGPDAQPGMSLALRIAVLHGGRIDTVMDGGHASGSALYLPLSC